MSNALQKMDELPLATTAQQEGLTLAAAWRAVASSEIDSEKLKVMKELLAMDAERKFNAAFVALQSELPTIQGVRPVTTKTGELKFKYANFDDIDEIVRPICLRHGFSYSFRETGMENGRVTVAMTLQHIGGHSREIPCSVRIGSGPPGASESQADMSGHAYAQRGAIESGLALRIVGQKEDAGVTSGVITDAQADELERRVALLNQPHDKFLKWLGSSSYKQIPASKYDQADDFLSKKERAL